MCRAKKGNRMSYIKTISEINEEEYNKLIVIKRNDIKTFHERVVEIASKSLFKPNAYGCTIPMEVFQQEGKYYVSWNRWDSCD